MIPQGTSWAEYLMNWLFYVGMPVLTYDASAMCLDLNLSLPEADLKDPVVPVCNRCTPSISLLVNCAT